MSVTKRTLGLCVIALSVGIAWLSGVQPAQAPEPAYLTQPLATDYGSTATGAYVSSAQTTILRWRGSYYYAPHLPVGQPCFTYTSTTVPSGTQTSKVIHGSGNYRACL